MRRYIVPYGLYTAVGVSAYLLLFWLLNKEWLFNTWLAWAVVLVYVTGMYLGNTKARQTEGSLPFILALRNALGIFTIAAVAYYAVFYTLFVVDPNLLTIQHEVVLEQFEALKPMLTEEQIEQQSQQLDIKYLKPTPGKMLLNLAYTLMGGFLLSLIISFATRRER